MPFLNPPDVLPEAMRFLIRALLASDGSLPEDELFRLVAPLGLVEAIGRSVPEESTDAPDSATGFKLGGRTIARTSLAALRTVQLVEQQTVGHRIVTATRERPDPFHIVRCGDSLQLRRISQRHCSCRLAR